MSRTLQSLMCAAGLLPGLVIGQTNSLARYQAIVQRNLFGLKLPLPAPPALPAVEPKEDLLLTGLADLDHRRCALFILTEPGKPAASFTLYEGEQNEWLEVRSIQLKDATVKGILKKPVVRMRNVGAEVVLSFQAQRGNPTP